MPRHSTSFPITVTMLVLLTVVWGGTFPATKLALEITNPMHFLALRFLVALVILTPFLPALRRSSVPGVNISSFPNRETWKVGVWVGLFMFIGFALQVVGLKYTTASRSGFFTSLLVLITPFLAHILRTSRTSLIALAGVPLALLGVYFLSNPETGGLNRGDWLTIGCAFAFSCQMVSLEFAASRVDDSWGLTYIQMLIITGGALIWCLIEGIPLIINSDGWLAVGYTAVFGGIGAVYLQSRYQPETTAGHASLIFTLEPVFASIFAYLLLGDSWTTRALIGASLILSSMVWSSFFIKNNTRNGQ
ncbi:MAG: DMT family transporter [Calditrichaeota bacterium]|nr:DMT family transporter [Calditrichota bacterium]MBT7617967.1 DMT family transporter [Calditrichota bacterium]MBT7788591.1 DMT family transporter [Calditrichota bacterium]